jgi:hypothetical protein
VAEQAVSFSEKRREERKRGNGEIGSRSAWFRLSVTYESPINWWLWCEEEKRWVGEPKPKQTTSHQMMITQKRTKHENRAALVQLVSELGSFFFSF